MEATKELANTIMGRDLRKYITCLQHKFKCCELLGSDIDISGSICKGRCAVMGEVAAEQ